MIKSPAPATPTSPVEGLYQTSSAEALAEALEDITSENTRKNIAGGLAFNSCSPSDKSGSDVNDNGERAEVRRFRPSKDRAD